MHQAIQVFIRRKRLFIIPFLIVFLVPAIYSAVFMRSYEANSIVWLDSDVNIAPVLQSDVSISGGDDPIQEQADTLQQLLESRAFISEVITDTPLGVKMTTARKQESTIQYVRKNLQSEVVGPNSLRITFYGRSPDEAVSVASAATKHFLNWVRDSVKEQNQKSIDFFTQRSDAYRQELQDARAAVQAYQEKHPETRELDVSDKLLTAPTINVSPAVESEYKRLQSEQDYAQEIYDKSLTDLAETRVLASAQEERLVNGLRIIDEPIGPTSFSKKRLLLLDFLALMAAMVVGALAVVLAELTDRTFRSVGGVQDALHLPVLVEIGDRERRRSSGEA